MCQYSFYWLYDMWLYGYIYNFSVNYVSINLNYLLGIHKYLVKNAVVKLCWDIFK